MAAYSFRLEMAWIGSEPDNEAWALYRRLRTVAEKSPMQLNSFTLLKDGRDFPTSLEEHGSREEYDRRQRLEGARRRAAELWVELDKVKKTIDALS